MDQKKTLIYSVGGLLIGVLAWLLASSFWLPNAEPKTDAIETLSQKPSLIELTSPPIKNKSEVAVVASEGNETWVWDSKLYDEEWCNYNELMPAERQLGNTIYLNYMESLGYFLASSQSGAYLPDETVRIDYEDYKTYGKSVLESLAKGGDMRALQSLFEHPGISLPKRYWSAKESAILGGTLLPTNYGAAMITAAFLDTLESDDMVTNNSDYLDGLAWGYFSSLRGDFNGWENALSLFEKLGTRNFEGAALSEDNLKYIRQKALQYHKEILKERKERGLGDFDEKPKSAIAFDDLYLAQSFMKYGIEDRWPPELVPKTDCFGLIRTWAEKNQ